MTAQCRATTRFCSRCWPARTVSIRGRCAQGRELHRSARRRRQGTAHRHRQGRLWASRLRARRRRQGHGGRRSFSRSSAPPSMKSRCRCICWRRRSGCRSRPKARTEFMMKGNGMGTNWRGLYNTTLLDAHSGWRASRRRTVRQPEDHDAARAIFHQALSRPFLRQGAEPEPQAARRLRCGAGAITICC